MSEPFEVLEHTADIGFRAWGDTPAELFENAARAMMSIAAETETIDPRGEVATQAAGEEVLERDGRWESRIFLDI